MPFYLAEYVFIPVLYCEQDVTQGQFWNEVQLLWIQSFFFAETGCYTKIKEPNLLDILLLTGTRVNILIHAFPMQPTSSRIWARANKFIY